LRTVEGAAAGMMKGGEKLGKGNLTWAIQWVSPLNICRLPITKLTRPKVAMQAAKHKSNA
jgi:hypothetical protein